MKVDSSDSDDKEESESEAEESDDGEPKRHRCLVGMSHAKHGVPHMLKIIPNCFDPSCRFAF